MAVRFLPPPGESDGSPGEDRPNIAEVIEFRSALQQRRWLEASEEPPAAASAEAPEESEAPRGEPAPGQHGSGTHSATLRSARSLLGEGRGSSPDAAPDAPAAEVIIASFARPSRAGADSGSGEGERGAEARRERGAGGSRADADGNSEASAEVPMEAAEEQRPENSCTDDGVRLLARRARSSGELRSDLLALGHSNDEVEATIAEFEESCYLDDEGLARALVEKLRDSKRASRGQIRRKLRERRLPDEAIERAVGDLDDDEEYALLRETAQQRASRLGGLDRQTAERRLLGFLARRGWSGEPAVRAARDALDGAGRPSGGVRFR